MRQPRIEDVDELARIHVAAWETTFRGKLDDAVIDERTIEVRQRMWTRIVTEPKADEVAVIVEADGEVRGFTFGAPGNYEDEDPERIINLNSIFIDPDFKGRGVAAAVHQGFLEECARRGYEEVSGQVHPDNAASQRFLIEKGGWHRDGYEREVAGLTEWRIKRDLGDVKAALGL